MSGTNMIPTPSPNGVGGVPAGGDAAAQVVAALTAKQPGMDAMGNQVASGDRVDRDAPTVSEARRRLVNRWTARVKADKKHHEGAFKRMRRNGRFANGEQWQQDDRNGGYADGKDKRYVANVTLRHVQQRTASLYASNPKVVCRQRERMLATIWDGDMVTLQAAQQQMAAAVAQQQQITRATGVPPQPGVPPPGLSESAMAILTDFANVQGYNKMLKRVGKTLELLWEYNVSEQTYSFKSMMKLTVRRAIVSGVGYVKLGFQRAMQINPEYTQRIADMTERLVNIQRVSDDIADGKLDRDSADAEQLRLAIQALMQEAQVITREGLTFDYPDSSAIIPDKKCKTLREFLGADWVTQEYMLTRDEIQEIYNVDVGTSYRTYSAGGDSEPSTAEDAGPGNEGLDGASGRAAVWEIYSRKDGLIYVVCDGYADFLREPASPDVYLDRFWPWFAMVLNEGYHENEVYPVSDVDLMRDMQLELNRARQGLREHRRANRPKMATAAGMLEPSDKEKLMTHPANAVIELNALAPGQKIEDVLQPVKMPPIDPALYDTSPTFEDLLRVLGQDQASTGQTTDATATEASVAQSAQHTDLASVLDDQDELLTALAQAAGKVLLLNVSAQSVQKIVGPGAVWPELTKEDVAENLYLEVEAGSTGRPNKQQEVMNAQLIFPMLQRMPGINPEWMARELLKRLDDRMDLTDAFIAGQPSMDAINRIQGTVAAPPPSDPTNPHAPPPGAAPGGTAVSPTGATLPPPPPGAGPAPPGNGGPNDPQMQGPQGAQNAPVPPPVNGLLGPRTPPVPGANGAMPGKNDRRVPTP